MSNTRLASYSILIGLIVLGLKTLAAYWTGSLALKSDALESIINVVAAIIALIALKMSEKPADRRHPYGHYKIEYLSAVFEGVLIVVAALYIFKESYAAFFTPKPLELTPLAVGVTLLASLINGLWAMILLQKGKAARSPALIADAKHLFTDVLPSLAVIAGLLIGIYTQNLWLDPLLAALVGLIILYSGFSLISSSVSSLLDEAGSPQETDEIRAIIKANAEGAIEAHDVRSRHAGRAMFIEFHLVVDGAMSVTASHEICDRIEAALRAKFSNLQVLIHVEPQEKAKHKGVLVV